MLLQLQRKFDLEGEGRRRADGRVRELEDQVQTEINARLQVSSSSQHTSEKVLQKDKQVGGAGQTPTGAGQAVFQNSEFIWNIVPGGSSNYRPSAPFGDYYYWGFFYSYCLECPVELGRMVSMLKYRGIAQCLLVTENSSIIGPRLWNSLASNIRQTDKLQKI